jgi:hypothetical protein
MVTRTVVSSSATTTAFWSPTTSLVWLDMLGDQPVAGALCFDLDA